MRTPASIKGHPIHALLVAIPIGLWVCSMACDAIALANNGGFGWERAAFYAVGGGIIGALVAAVPGLVDLFSLRGPVQRIGLWHMAVNLVSVGLFGVSFWMRMQAGPESMAIGPVVFSGLGLAAILVGGWLGGEMVYVHRVGVSEARVTETPVVQQPIPQPYPQRRSA